MDLSADDAVTAYFALDHRLIDRLLARFLRAAEPAAAAAALDAVEGRLLRHIAWEENALFPAFEEKVGDDALARVVAMRVQHGELKDQLGLLRASLDAGGCARRNAEEVLLETLADHNHAEEEFIYPWIDGAMSPAERRVLLSSLA